MGIMLSRPDRPDMAPRRNPWLYMLHASDGTLLYVGTTRSPFRRMAEHARDKTWWPDVERVAWFMYEDKGQVLAAEAEVTRWLRPRYNKQPRCPVRLSSVPVAHYDDHVSEVV